MMTDEQAIEILEEVKELDDSMFQFNPSYMEALDYVIQKMKDGYFMSLDEAIEILENIAVTPDLHPDEQWKWDKAIEMAIKALKEKRGV